MATTPSIPRLLLLLSKRDQTLATAESITAGLISAALTDIAGASKIFKGGIVAYSDEVKHDVLGVPTIIFRDEEHSSSFFLCRS
ncbi:CinA-domain-containing protein [Rhizoclosmatium globosum]|uniref:CinA-domain-containing protein n=1 Tax=Rhizoclosmatium globosum TaxID=329046 RepID=A0A1Y2C6Q0_9FUNG|nr:CinA-domain-containing protein [Rhizoclosmatium globosum]|eukprot:ORY42557.1 CinA-domain-containing protein [Rhizoclosmatium globosum]